MGRTILFALCINVCLIASPAMAAEFTADMAQTVDGKQIAAGKVTVKDRSLRMDMRIDGEQQVSIIDPAARKVILIMPTMHSYMEMPYDAHHAGAAALAQADPGQGTWRAVGKETIDGWDCEKRVLEAKDPADGEITAWFATKLDYPIRIVQKAKTVSVIEYKNIKTGGVDAALFTAPSGFQKMSMPGMPPMTQGGKP